MFAMRGLAVSFSIFVLLYSTLSLAVCGAWRSVFSFSRRYAAKRVADILFTLRLIPFVLAGGITLALAVPSFLLLEPRVANEPMSPAPVALGVFGLGILLIGVWRAGAALLRASQTVARWSRESQMMPDAISGGSVCVRRIAVNAPPLTAAGIFRPSVWLSRAAEFVLSERELQSALRHEVAHVRRRDNLRKLALQVVAFPGMAQLENAWREATEMAADDAAVASVSEALDLAAAVIKLSRLVALEPPAELTTALVHSPVSALNARVERLIEWTEPRNVSPQHSVRYLLCVAATIAVTLAVTYSDLLVRVHAATEWLVR